MLKNKGEFRREKKELWEISEELANRINCKCVEQSITQSETTLVVLFRQTTSK